MRLRGEHVTPYPGLLAYRFLVLFMVQLWLFSCHAPFLATPPARTQAAKQSTWVMGPGNENLLRPRTLDWSTQRFSAPRIATERKAWAGQLAQTERNRQKVQNEGGVDKKYTLQAFPDISASWSYPSGNEGVPMTGSPPSLDSVIASITINSGDYVPNGPASVFAYGGDGDGLENRVLFLSYEGKLLKLKRGDPLTDARGIDLGKNFSRTYISLSPRGNRAFVISDDGTFFVIDTTGDMQQQASASLGQSALGIAPSVDPMRSDSGGTSELVFVPLSDGTVREYAITASSSGTLTAANTYTLTSATPASGTARITSPCVAFDRRLFVGDAAGNFIDYNTDGGASQTYAISTTGIETPPAIEIQDGTYGSEYGSVANDAPLFAFVNVTQRSGPVCAWVELATQNVWYSRPLYLDDNAATNYDDLLDYNFDASDTIRYLPAADALNVSQDFVATLPGATGTYTRDSLSPALRNITVTTDTPASFSIGSPSPGKLVFDNAGNIWVARGTTISRFSTSGTAGPTNVFPETANGIAYDSVNNYVWVCTNDTAGGSGAQKLYRINADTGASSTYNLGYKNTLDIAGAPDGAVWILSDQDDRIAKIDTSPAAAGNLNIPSKPFKRIACDPGGTAVWATIGGGGTNEIVRVDASNIASYTVFTDSAEPNAIAVAQDGSIWVSYGSEIKHYSYPGSGSSLTSLHTVSGISNATSLAIDNSGGVFAAAGSQLYYVVDSVIQQTQTIDSDSQGVALGSSTIAVSHGTPNTLTTLARTSASTGVRSYLRFNDANYDTLATGSVLTSAQLTLRTNNQTTSCFPLRVHPLGTFGPDGYNGFYLKNTTTLWPTSGAFTSSNAPDFGATALGNLPATGTTTTAYNFPANQAYSLDVTDALAQNVPRQHFAFGLQYDGALTGNNNVYWRDGPLTANTSGSTTPLFAPKFSTDAGNTSAVVDASTETRPMLTLRYKQLNNPHLEAWGTSPIIDVSSGQKRVYCYNTNTLFSLDFNSRKRWTDTEYSAFSASGSKRTCFERAYLGISSAPNNGGAKEGANYIRNRSTPVVNFDLDAIYVLSYHPGSTNYDVCVSKFTLPLVPGATSAKLVSSTVVVNTTSTGGSSYLGIDPFTTNSSTSAGVYVGFQGTERIYRYQP
ncbi:MAG: hypothetical protein VKN33_00950 [Candidatus Sericytochromatia bacterium]|nr:hypothetical protein [Candidatus Sericytochromatia bacterium]